MSEPALHQNPERPKSVWPMFVAALVMIALFVGFNEWMRSSSTEGSQEEVVRAEARRKNLAELQDADQRELGEYSWLDRDAGTVRIPINRAMELALASLNQGEPEAAYPIDSLAGAAPATGTGSGEVPNAAGGADAAVEETASEEAAADAALDAAEADAAAATEVEAEAEEAAAGEGAR